MGNIESSIDCIRREFPEVSIQRKGAQVIFEGRFILRGKYKGFVMEAAPRLKIIMNNNYPDIPPEVFDVDNAIDYDHKFKDGALCVATPIDISLGLLNSKSISDYINLFLIPYFISFKYWKQSGKKKDIYGDRSHGYEGYIETLADFFDLSYSDKNKVILLLAWAAKIKKFKKLFSKEQQPLLIKKYITKIERLRRIGFDNLKKYYKDIIKTVNFIE